MFSWQSKLEFGYDLYNKEGRRNVRNTDRSSFNCGGYALGVYAWYLPYESDRYGFVWGQHLSPKRIEELTDQCTEFMLRDFTDLRVIESVKDLEKGEYAIAFRIGSNGDFHYVKRNRMGLWTHKRGGSPQIRIMHKEEVFAPKWCDTYEGRIVLFAKKSS